MADSPELVALTQEVNDTVGVMQSAEVFISGLKAALDAAIAANNPAALTALSASLGVEKANLAAAIAANPGPTARR